MTKVRSVIPWSWSTLDSYETCPKLFYEEKIAKTIPFKETQEIIWGNEVHKAFEQTIRDDAPWPARMSEAWHNIALKFKAAPGDKYVERELGVTAELKPTGFWDADAWNRGKDDITIINGAKAFTGDWKTGKEKKYSGQLEVSALRIMAHHPEVKEVDSAFAWLATGKWTRAKFHRDNYNRMWESYFDRIAKMLWSEQHNIWPAKPSGLCRKSMKPGSTWMGCQVTNCIHSSNYKKP